MESIIKYVVGEMRVIAGAPTTFVIALAFDRFHGNARSRNHPGIVIDPTIPFNRPYLRGIAGSEFFNVFPRVGKNHA
jgi:hypothetical protein